MIIFTLEGDYIPLIALLKATQMAQSGGHAQRLVEDGLVTVNGMRESRKRAKIRRGDTVGCLGQLVRVE